MRLIPLAVSVALVAPGLVAAMYVRLRTHVPALGMGAAGDGHTWLLMSTSNRHDYVLVGTESDAANPSWESGNASFRHTSDEMIVDCHLDAYDYNGDLGDFVYDLASLSDTNAHPCGDFHGVRLICGDVIGANGQVVPGARQMCTG